SFPITTRRKVSPCDDGYIYIPIVFVVMLYMVYLVECWHSSTRLELIHKMDANAIYDHIQQMRESQPIIWWKAVCYHYIRRTRQITRYRNGEAYTTTQIYYERVNTHVAASCFSYGSCGVKDISKKLIDLEKFPTTKIRFSKGFAFANLEAANEFEDQRGRFFQENERRDDYLEMREGLDLVGCNFREYMVSFANKNRLPWYISHFSFWLFSFFLLSWPLRVLIEFKTSYLHYQITKLFGSNFATPAINRATTVDSIDLINNCVIAPSYSEAVLVSQRNQLLGEEDRDANAESLDAVNGMMKICSENSDNRSVSILSSHLPNSCSRQSLVINGQMVYFVSPLQTNDEPVISRRSSIRHVDIDTVENPPNYEEALLHCRPVFANATFLNLSPLRRSITSQDFIKRLTSHLRRPWGSTLDVRDGLRLCPEIQL
ncbi:transmembrane protein 151B-like protein, partial [Dinothrombium tinctorium]